MKKIRIKWKNVSKNPKVVELIKKRNKLEDKIRELDKKALINYELIVLGLKKYQKINIKKEEVGKLKC